MSDVQIGCWSSEEEMILDSRIAKIHRKNLRKLLLKINRGEMLSLDEVNDSILVLGALVDDLITVVKEMVEKR